VPSGSSSVLVQDITVIQTSSHLHGNDNPIATIAQRYEKIRDESNLQLIIPSRIVVVVVIVVCCCLPPNAIGNWINEQSPQCVFAAHITNVVAEHYSWLQMERPHCEKELWACCMCSDGVNTPLNILHPMIDINFLSVASVLHSLIDWRAFISEIDATLCAHHFAQPHQFSAFILISLLPIPKKWPHLSLENYYGH
jgi:hypothetical protein